MNTSLMHPAALQHMGSNKPEEMCILRCLRMRMIVMLVVIMMIESGSTWAPSSLRRCASFGTQ